MKPPTTLEKKLGYVFKQRSWMDTALRHSSYVNEQPTQDLENNERLEFLGDAVLNLIAGHILMKRHPRLKEGELSRMRASTVNETQLAKAARSIQLGRHLQLGKGEIQTRGREKNSILADAFEAVIAAVYLDGGIDAAFQVVESRFDEMFEAVPEDGDYRDYKSQLQEYVQMVYKITPSYRVIQEAGPDHDKIFTVQLKIKKISVQGVGKSKKTAEQAAARQCLEILQRK